MRPGQAYVVGEQRPELFIPGRSGTIANFGETAQNVNIEVHGIVRGDADIVAIAEQVAMRVSRGTAAMQAQGLRNGRLAG